MMVSFFIRYFVVSVVAILLGFVSLSMADSGREPAAERRSPKVVYPKNAKLDFEGADIEGELRNPADFYFQYRKPEKFGSLLKRRPNFHREMLRDAMMGK